MNELSRDQVAAVVERAGCAIVPMHQMNYWNQGTVEKYGQDRLNALHAKYPDDVVMARYPWSDWDSLRTGEIRNKDSIDARVVVADYGKIDELAERIRGLARNIGFEAEAKIRQDNPMRYCMGYTWFGIWERLWMLRGMENACMDFYEHPDEVKKLIRALCDYHLEAIHNYGRLGFDAIATSDDLGGQNSTLFSKEIFDEFFKPMYKEMFSCAHSYGMHMWMHSCGHIMPLLDDLIGVGLDVIHPIQHSTHPAGVSANDIQEMVRRFKGKVTFWAGIDVQYLMPLGTPEDVRRGVRELIDTFSDSNGGMIIAAGNGIMPETPFENIEAFYDEAYAYGGR